MNTTSIVPPVSVAPSLRQSIPGVVLLCLLASSFAPASPVLAADHYLPGSGRKAVEREKRFLQLAVDDFAAARRIAEEDIGDLERQRAAITPLEPVRREEDLSDLLDWYYRYSDWIAGEHDQAEGELGLLLSPRAGEEPQIGSFAQGGAAEKELARELAEKVKGYRGEQKRLADTLEQRRLLQLQSSELEAKLALLSGREGDREEQRRLQEKIRVVRAQLSALPDIDENILRHYSVLIEHGSWQSEWLVLEIAEYDALQSVASLIASRDSVDIAALEESYQRLNRTYADEVLRLTRMRDQIDRIRSRMSPAGTLREADRSKDLMNLYDRLQQRFDRGIRELKVRSGACEAELAALYK